MNLGATRTDQWIRGSESPQLGAKFTPTFIRTKTVTLFFGKKIAATVLAAVFTVPTFIRHFHPP